MKKIVLFLLAVAIGAGRLGATEPAKNDTTIRFNKKIIHLEDSVGQMKVKVFDSDSVPYKAVYEGVFSDGKSYEKYTVIEELGVQFPFLNNLTKKKAPQKYKMKAHWAGIGWGFANISNSSYQLNNVDGVSLKSESSNEFFINPIEKIIPIIRNNIGLTSGIGMGWHNYFMDMDAHLIENAAGVTVVEHTGFNYEYSRLRTFGFTVPLMLEWQPSFGKNHKFYLTAGVVGGVNTYSSFKVKYKDANGRTIKEVESKGLNIAPLSLDYMAQIGYGSWSVYAKYSPFGIFQSQKGPNVRAVSLGAMLNF